MLYRLAAAVHRKGTINRQFVSRIPVDVRDRAVGLSLVVPIGSETVRCTIKTTTTTIRLSLRTAVPGEVRQRQAEVAAYFEAL